MRTPSQSDCEVRHATTVAVKARGLMIAGASGAGKSSLALQMLALGARLVADDATRIWRGRGAVPLWAGAPETLPARIEARGAGLLPARLFGPVPLVAVLALDQTEADRLPREGTCTILGQDVTLLRRPRDVPLAAVMRMVLAGATA